MEVRELRPGLKFIDPALLSSPVEYRIHQVTEVFPEHFDALHLASQNVRRFPREVATMARLKPVPDRITVVSFLEALVAEAVTIKLADGGTLHGMITAIRYHEVVIDGVPARVPREIEIDRSGATSYKWTEIKSITKMARET